MKGDFSRISHEPSKHYVGVLSQQGRVQLDSDWNEQTLIIHDLLKNTFSDIIGDFFCIGDSFRICKKIPLDHMSNPELWNGVKKNPADSISKIVLTHEHKPVLGDNLYENGSLLVSDSNIIERKFDSLDLSRSKSLSIKIKPLSDDVISENNNNSKIILTLFKKINYDTRILFTHQLNGEKDDNGFYTVTIPLNNEYGIVVSDSGENIFDLSNILKISIEWSMKSPVCIGIIETEPLIPIISGDFDLRDYPWVNVNDESYSTEIDIEKRYNGKPSIIIPDNKSEIYWQFQFPKNFESLDTISFSSNAFYKPNLFVVTDSNEEIDLHVLELQQPKNKELEWYQYKFDVKGTRNDPIYKEKDFRKINSIGIRNLPLDEIRISEFLGSIDLENDFIIMGKGLNSNTNSRMYVSGIQCQKELNETFLTQQDYPVLQSLLDEPEGSESEKNTKSNYLVYADIWERGISYIEDPTLREIALSGPDTSTRIKTTCQIKLKEIPLIEDFKEKIKIINNEIQKLKSTNCGRLSTITSNTNQSNDYVGLDNRFYRIQIHDSGTKEDNNATFKWSYDNASTFYSIKSHDSFSVSLVHSQKNIDSDFKIGDLIEIIDDFDELSELPKGNLRRITSIDIDSMTLSWASSNLSDVSGITYLNEPISKNLVLSAHPKIIKWEGIKKINSDSNEILLADDTPNKMVSDDSGIKVRFTDGNYWCGDYWNFLTRTLTDSVQKLSYELPHGIKHFYAPLALIEKNNDELRIIMDLRKSINNPKPKDDSPKIPPPKESVSEQTLPEIKVEEVDYEKIAKMVLEIIVGKDNARLLLNEDENIRNKWLLKIKKLLKN